jgi:hypothetical protein
VYRGTHLRAGGGGGSWGGGSYLLEGEVIHPTHPLAVCQCERSLSPAMLAEPAIVYEYLMSPVLYES